MVTREEILKIAKLSKLSVTEEELDGLTAARYVIPAGYHSGAGTVTLTDDIEAALALI